MQFRREPEIDDGQCDARSCRCLSEIAILSGATPINPYRRGDLCGRHHARFWEEFRTHSKQPNPPENHGTHTSPR